MMARWLDDSISRGYLLILMSNMVITSLMVLARATHSFSLLKAPLICLLNRHIDWKGLRNCVADAVRGGQLLHLLVTFIASVALRSGIALFSVPAMHLQSHLHSPLWYLLSRLIDALFFVCAMLFVCQHFLSSSLGI